MCALATKLLLVQVSTIFPLLKSTCWGSKPVEGQSHQQRYFEVEHNRIVLEAAIRAILRFAIRFQGDSHHQVLEYSFTHEHFTATSCSPKAFRTSVHISNCWML